MKHRKILLLLPCILAGNLLAQTLPSGKRLTDNGMLIGATAEVGSADKEGLFGWKDGAKVEADFDPDHPEKIAFSVKK